MSPPRLLVLTDRHQSEAAGRALPETVAAAVDAGATAIVLREKDLASPERERLGHVVRERVARGRAELIVASDAGLAAELDADGVHLSAADPLPTAEGRQVGRLGRLGRSCHDLDEIAAAQQEPLDYLTISPINPTASKPGYGPAVGVAGLRGAAAASRVPVLALGGVEPAQVEELLTAGAHGVAVMGAVMRADDPASVVAAFNRALGEPT